MTERAPRIAKTALRNIIRHTDAHNRIVEEDECWRQYQLQSRPDEASSSSRYNSGRSRSPQEYFSRQSKPISSLSRTFSRTDGTSRVLVNRGTYLEDFDSDATYRSHTARSRSSSTAQGHVARSWSSSTAHMDRPEETRACRYEEVDQSRGRFEYTNQLYKAEINDPNRWGHGGYKELYPDEFDPSPERSINPKRSIELLTVEKNLKSSKKSEKKKKASKSRKEKHKTKAPAIKQRKKKRRREISTSSSTSSETSSDTSTSTSSITSSSTSSDTDSDTDSDTNSDSPQSLKNLKQKNSDARAGKKSGKSGRKPRDKRRDKHSSAKNQKRARDGSESWKDYDERKKMRSVTYCSDDHVERRVVLSSESRTGEESKVKEYPVNIVRSVEVREEEGMEEGELEEEVGIEFEEDLTDKGSSVGILMEKGEDVTAEINHRGKRTTQKESTQKESIREKSTENEVKILLENEVNNDKYQSMSPVRFPNSPSSDGERSPKLTNKKKSSRRKSADKNLLNELQESVEVEKPKALQITVCNKISQELDVNLVKKESIHKSDKKSKSRTSSLERKNEIKQSKVPSEEMVKEKSVDLVGMERGKELKPKVGVVHGQVIKNTRQDNRAQTERKGNVQEHVIKEKERKSAALSSPDDKGRRTKERTTQESIDKSKSLKNYNEKKKVIHEVEISSKSLRCEKSKEKSMERNGVKVFRAEKNVVKICRAEEKRNKTGKDSVDREYSVHRGRTEQKYERHDVSSAVKQGKLVKTGWDDGMKVSKEKLMKTRENVNVKYETKQTKNELIKKKTKVIDSDVEPSSSEPECSNIEGKSRNMEVNSRRDVSVARQPKDTNDLNLLLNARLQELENEENHKVLRKNRELSPLKTEKTTTEKSSGKLERSTNQPSHSSKILHNKRDESNSKPYSSKNYSDRDKYTSQKTCSSKSGAVNNVPNRRKSSSLSSSSLSSFYSDSEDDYRRYRRQAREDQGNDADDDDDDDSHERDKRIKRKLY